MRGSMATVFVVALAGGCGDKLEHPTRDECVKAADQVADVIMKAYTTTKVDEFWDGIHNNPGDNRIPPEVTKESFRQWLAAPESAEWRAWRLELARQGTRSKIDQCMKGLRKIAQCIGTVTSLEEVDACDRGKR
jgi:hypothetical protein